MKQITRMLCIGLAAMAFAACSSEEEKKENVTINALVLNEGSWGNSNASITALDTHNGGTRSNWFSNANGRNLGDVAQDIVKYGSKVYATVTFSNSLEVIDPATGNATHVDMGDRNPRHIAADGGKLYITCYNPCSVVRIDTATLEIEATCHLGQYHPEGIAIVGGKAFVASSITADYSSYDDKLYVVDLASFANPTTVTVGLNASTVKAIDNTKVLVCYAGDYGENLGGSAIVNTNTLEVTQTNLELAGCTTYNGTVYAYASSWTEDPDSGDWNQTVGFFQLNPNTLASSPISALSGIASPYGIDIDPSNGDIYVCESISGANGDLHCFTKNGEKRFTSEVGVFPKKVIFL